MPWLDGEGKKVGFALRFQLCRVTSDYIHKGTSIANGFFFHQEVHVQLPQRGNVYANSQFSI